MKNDTYEVNKKNITVISIGSLLVLKKFFKSKFFDVQLIFDLLSLLIIIKSKTLWLMYDSQFKSLVIMKHKKSLL